jgi:hypothetical protein
VKSGETRSRALRSKGGLNWSEFCSQKIETEPREGE